MPFINYNYLIEESLNEVYVFDATTLQFYNVNRSAREHLGYTLDELREMTPLDLKPDYTQAQYAKLIAPLRTGEKKKITFSTVHRRKNGSTYPIEVHLQYETFQGINVFVALILDMTEQKRIESYNISLSHIFNVSLNEIYIFDAVTLKFIEVNMGACHNLGYRPDELREMTPLNIKPEMTPASFSELLMPLRLGEKEKIEFITTHQRKDGSIYPVEVHLQLSTFGERSVFVAIILDITEREFTQQTMLTFAMKAERMRLLKQFISDTSHEFRNPMAVINTKIYLLQQSTDDSRSLEHLETMEKQVQRLEQLIEGLHRLSELDSTDTIQMDRIDIHALMDDLVARFKKRYSDRDYTIRYAIADEVSTMTGDEEKLNLALYHVIKNAFEYTPEQGEIDIRVFHENDQLRVDIQDTGVGIAATEIPHIFDRLYRTDLSRNTQTGGVGLGLAIVRRVFELHGGDITVHSQIGEGTCFCLSLPLAHPSGQPDPHVLRMRNLH